LFPPGTFHTPVVIPIPVPHTDTTFHSPLTIPIPVPHTDTTFHSPLTIAIPVPHTDITATIVATQSRASSVTLTEIFVYVAVKIISECLGL